MNSANLNSFLKFGYFLDYKSSLTLDMMKRPKVFEGSYIDALIKAKELWLGCFEKQWSNGVNTVPLSGGLDSRILLGTLLHFESASNIKTLTYGTRDTWDVSIPEQISKWTGTKHSFIDMKNEPVLNVDELVKTSRRFENQTMLYYHPPFDIMDNEVGDSNVWNGVLIDVIMGKHGLSKVKLSRDTAIEKFESKNIFGNSTLYPDPLDRSLYTVPSPGNGYPEEYIIDLLNRQLKLVVPHVMPKGYNWCHMIDSELVDFIFSLPSEWHNKQQFYLDLAQLIIPDEYFDFPCTTFLGASISSSQFVKGYKKILFAFNNRTNWSLTGGLNLGMNYFSTPKLKYNDRFMRLVSGQIDDLSRRQIIPNRIVEKICKDITSGEAQYIAEAIILSSLEIHHKANPEMQQLYG